MKVSICIPAYKHLDFLKRSLDSILEQDFSDYEIVITDDSPDNSLEKLVISYNEPRINYYKNTTALGSPENWNEGLRKAKGEYIKIMHHDDWFTRPDSLRLFVDMLDSNPQADIAFSASCDIHSNNERIEHVAQPSFLKAVRQEAETVYLHNRFGAPSACIFRNKPEYRFDIEQKWLVDIDFYIDTIKKGGFVYSSDILVYIGVSEHQITQLCMTDNSIRIREKIYLFNKLNLDRKSNKYRRSLLRTLGREKIFGSKSLKQLLPDSQFTFTLSDSIIAAYYWFKRQVYDTLFK